MVCRFGKLGPFLFQKVDLSRRYGFFEGPDDDLVWHAVANGEFGNDGHAEICGDHGECGFKLVALEALFGLIKLTGF